MKRIDIAKLFGSVEGQCSITWALSEWLTAPIRTAETVANATNAARYPMPTSFPALCAVNSPKHLAKILVLQLNCLGLDARPLGWLRPDNGGEFIMIGVCKDDQTLLEIDTPEQCQTFTVEQARKMLFKLRHASPKQDHKIRTIVRGD